MGVLQAIDRRVEKFIVESDSFKNSVKEAFTKADLDGNGVIAPKEVAAMSDTMFDLVERELGDYGIRFKRPTEEEVVQFLKVADRNQDYVLNEDEFFEFYRQVVKYCAVVSARGFFRRYAPKMLIGLVATCAVKCGVSKIPAVGPTVSPVLNLFPTVIVGPILGLVVAFHQRDGGNKTLQEKLFIEDGVPSTTEPGTSRRR